MENILLATDFTECANHAMEYAKEMAKVAYSKLTLLNVVTIEVIDPVIPSFYLDPVVKDQEEESRKRLEVFKKRLEKELYPDQTPFNVDVITSVGVPAQEINQIAGRIKADLIIAGNKGADMVERFVGTTVSDLAELSGVPFLAVPLQADFSRFEKIIYASGLKEGDIPAIQSTIKFAEIFNSEVLILHINESGLKEWDVEFNKVKKQIQYDLRYGKVHFECLHLKNASAVIDLVTEIDRADLVALRKVHRNFFSEIFHKSFTKEKLFKGNMPLLVHH